MTVVVDTSVLIDVLRGDAAAVEWMAELESVPACAEISRVEVIRGLRSAERAGAERLFDVLDWIPLDERVARYAGELGRQWRRSHAGIGTADLAIAATTELLGATLATANVRHFPMFKGLKPPYG